MKRNSQSTSSGVRGFDEIGTTIIKKELVQTLEYSRNMKRFKLGYCFLLLFFFFLNFQYDILYGFPHPPSLCLCRVSAGVLSPIVSLCILQWSFPCYLYYLNYFWSNILVQRRELLHASNPKVVITKEYWRGKSIFPLTHIC